MKELAADPSATHDVCIYRGRKVGMVEARWRPVAARTRRTAIAALRDTLARHQTTHGLVDSMRGRGAVLRPAHPLHGEQTGDFFFIIGSGRSGTTLVRRVLMSSPDVHIPPETHVLGPLIGSYRRYAYLAWDDLVRLCLAQLGLHPEFVHFEMSLAPVVRQLATLPREERCLAAIFRAVFEAHARNVGRDNAYLFGEKTPNSTEQVYRIRAVFPDARFLHVVRDGLDVACSFAEAGMFPLEEAAHVWLRRTKMARRFAARHPQACLTVRYEDLVAEPKPVVGELTAFLDIDPKTIDTEAVEHVDAMGDVRSAAYHTRVREPIAPARVGRWRASLDAPQIDALERIVGHERRLWGYESVTS